MRTKPDSLARDHVIAKTEKRFPEKLHTVLHSHDSEQATDMLLQTHSHDRASETHLVEDSLLQAHGSKHGTTKAHATVSMGLGNRAPLRGLSADAFYILIGIFLVFCVTAVVVRTSLWMVENYRKNDSAEDGVGSARSEPEEDELVHMARKAKEKRAEAKEEQEGWQKQEQEWEAALSKTESVSEDFQSWQCDPTERRGSVTIRSMRIPEDTLAPSESMTTTTTVSDSTPMEPWQPLIRMASVDENAIDEHIPADKGEQNPDANVNRNAEDNEADRAAGGGGKGGDAGGDYGY